VGRLQCRGRIATNALLCIDCPSGYFALPASSACLQGPLGRFAASSGLSVCRDCDECIPCSIGFYANSSAAMSCQPRVSTGWADVARRPGGVVHRPALHCAIGGSSCAGAPVAARKARRGTRRERLIRPTLQSVQTALLCWLLKLPAARGEQAVAADALAKNPVSSRDTRPSRGWQLNLLRLQRRRLRAAARLHGLSSMLRRYLFEQLPCHSLRANSAWLLHGHQLVASANQLQQRFLSAQ
jgi:hypothetical protein